MNTLWQKALLILLAVWLVAGGAIAGILIAILAIVPKASAALDLSRHLPASWNDSPWPALVAFGALTVVLFLVGTGHLLGSDAPAAVMPRDGEALDWARLEAWLRDALAASLVADVDRRERLGLVDDHVAAALQVHAPRQRLLDLVLDGEEAIFTHQLRHHGLHGGAIHLAIDLLREITRLGRESPAAAHPYDQRPLSPEPALASASNQTASSPIGATIPMKR